MDIVSDSQGETHGPAGDAGAVSPDLIRKLREDGVVLLKNALTADELAVIKDVFDSHLVMEPPWVIDRSTENARFLFAFLSPDMVGAPAFQRLWSETKLLDIAQQAFTTPEVWFWHEQIFFKEGSAGEKVARTEWHQDLAVDPLEGTDLLRFWITLEPVEKDYALEFVRGSHRGPTYSIGKAKGASNDASAMPPLPDIQADRSQWDIVSWATEPGDILAFHPGIIHGGAPTKPDGVRRTLVTVFIGRDARFSPKPPPPFGMSEDGPSRVMRDRLAKLRPGDPISLAMPRLR